MSLYNTLFGVNSAAPLLLAMLGASHTDVPRFRDCFLLDGKIVIYTRTGGGNRDAYENEERCRDNYPEYFTGDKSEWQQGPWNEDLRKLPGYIHDEDDGFDSTYANFYYEVPNKFKHLLDKIPEGDDPARRWQDTIAALQTGSPNDPQVKKVAEVLAPVFAALQKGESKVIKI